MIGEHGKTTVPVWSRVRIAGMSLEEYEQLNGATPISKQGIRDQIDKVSFDVMRKRLDKFSHFTRCCRFSRSYFFMMRIVFYRFQLSIKMYMIIRMWPLACRHV